MTPLRCLLLFLPASLLALCFPKVSMTSEEPWIWHEEPRKVFGEGLDEATLFRVTTLEASGPGSLRNAVEASAPGPRLIVFEVAGVIDLAGKSLRIREDQTWIAGQTAPSPGITLIRGGLSIDASQVVVQHLRIRPGDKRPRGVRKWEPDGITTLGAQHDILFEHCSVTWGIDENLSASSYGAREGTHARRITIRNCLIAEALHDSTHAEGPHSKGTLVLDGTQQVAIVGNLYAGNVERNPVFKPDTSGVIVNNVMACVGDRAAHASLPPKDSEVPPALLSVIGNTVLLGPESKRSAGIFEGRADAYFRDNVGANGQGESIALLRDSFSPLPNAPAWPRGLLAHPAAAAQWRVARFAGARPAERDPIDTRIVAEALSGTLRILDSQDEVGGYPESPDPSVTGALTVPETNRDAWLEERSREVEGRTLTRPTSERPRDLTRFAVATVHPLASQAAIDAFDRGGNAVDAAIAAAMTLGVVDGHNSGIGGGCFLLIHAADGTITAIDGREMAPSAATRDMFLVEGKADPDLSRTGALASGVPGALAAWELALERHGNLSLADLLLPAAAIAEGGFPIDEVWARKLRVVAEDMAQFPESAEIFLKPDGAAMEEGDTVIQTDLANSYRAIAEHGTRWFYHGPFAEKTEHWMAENGGILTAFDFARYHAKLRPPLRTTYRNLDIVGFPPPSSGGIHVAQVLRMIEPFPVAKLEPAQRAHLLAEAMKLAFADRAHWLGDADFAPVPRGLIDPDYVRSLSEKIHLKKIIPVPEPGAPPNAETDLFGDFDRKHTQHLCTADAAGNWVSMTSTINTGFGSKVVIPGTGILLNNEMDDFSAQPGVPNAFGLVGAEANAIVPGKRPLSSMSPTLVLRDGRVVMAIGAAGGPTIITQTIQNIVNRFDLGMDVKESLAAPRIHHQWSPDSLRVEKDLDPNIIAGLEELGHELAPATRLGVSQGITRDPQTGRFRPAHDPRLEGGAGGR